MEGSQPRHEFWFEHLRCCHEEGLTLKAYSEREGLTLSVLYGWNKRYKQQRIGTAGGLRYRRRMRPATIVSVRIPRQSCH